MVTVLVSGLNIDMRVSMRYKMVVSNADTAGQKTCRALVRACRGMAARRGGWVCVNVTSLENNGLPLTSFSQL